MNMQFDDSENLTAGEMHVQEELRKFWKKFGSGKFRTTCHCANCQDELLEYSEFTELIVPIVENHDNVT